MTEEMLERISSAQKGDKAASEKLIIENSGLIWSIARRFFGRGVEPDDLYQLGCVGFLKAIEGFDTSFGTQFSTYAVPKISGEIRRFLRDDGTVKVSRSIKEQAQLIRNARSRLEQQMGREPSLSELSAELGITPEDIAFAETAAGPAESLQRESGEDGFTLEHILTDGSSEERMLESISLRHAVDSLPERERMTVYLRYYRGFTQEKTAEILKVSQVQVSRIERKAMEHLREVLE